jgi:uncharacterized protein involved in exopolysaccharide biosynthesis/Mrp family chromosome partitioning ATPase
MSEASGSKRLLRPLVTYWPIIAISVLAAVIIASRYLKYSTPMYESTAKLKLADIHEGVPNSNLYKDFDIFTSSNKIAAEVELIKSKLIISNALDSLGFDVAYFRKGEIHDMEIYEEPPFSVKYSLHDSSVMNKRIAVEILNKEQFRITIPKANPATRVAKFGEMIFISKGFLMLDKNTNLLKKRPDYNFVDNYYFNIYTRDYVIDKIIGDNIDITAIDKDVPIIRLTYKSPVAEKAAAFSNALAKAYVDDYVKNRTSAAGKTVEFINSQLDDVSGKLANSENNIESYRDSKNIINIKQETETNLKKIAEMKIQLSNMKMNLSAMDSLYEYVQVDDIRFLTLAPNFEAFTDLLSTEMIKKIKQLESERKDLLLKYTAGNPQVKIIDSKLKDITSYLRESIKNTRNNLQIKYGEIEEAIAFAERDFIGLPTKEKTITILEREFNHYQNIYNFLSEKRTEASIAESATLNFHRVISKAEVPIAPISPKPTITMILAVFIALVLSVTFVYVLDNIRSNTYDSSQIEEVSHLSIIAEVPNLTGKGRNAFSSVAIRMSMHPSLCVNSVVAFTSYKSQEGKTYLANQFGKAMVRAGHAAIRVDFSGYFDNEDVSPVTKGLSPSELEKYIKEDLKNGLDTIQLGTIMNKYALFPGSKELSQLIQVLKEQYAYVLLDVPSLKENEEMVALLTEASATIVIYRFGKSTSSQIAYFNKLMLELRINNAFVINNMVEEGLNVGKPIKNLKNWIVGVMTTFKAKRNYQREGSMA